MLFVAHIDMGRAASLFLLIHGMSPAPGHEQGRFGGIKIAPSADKEKMREGEKEIRSC
jgi:hypothetical protein